jgi:hypothetical protein
MPGYALELETVQRVAKMLREYEGGGFSVSRHRDMPHDGAGFSHAVRVCAVTGSINSDGTYPAKLLGRNSENYSATWDDYETILLVDPNAATLTNGRRYVAVCAGWYGGSGSASGSGSGSAAPLWVVAGAVPASTLTQSVVTDVTCSGSTLVVTKKTLTIPGGTVS